MKYAAIINSGITAGVTLSTLVLIAKPDTAWRYLVVVWMMTFASVATGLYAICSALHTRAK